MQFLTPNITPQDFIDAARSYKNIRYNANHTVDGECADCAGFLMLSVRRCGLLPSDCDAGFSPSKGVLERGAILASVLHDNFTEIPLSDAQPGDLLRFKFDDTAGRHITIKTSNNPAPWGSIIHSMNGRVTNAGGVFEQRVDAHLREFLVKVYRLNQWLEHSAQLGK